MFSAKLLCILCPKIQFIVANGQIINILKSKSIFIIRESNACRTCYFAPKVRHIRTDRQIFKHFHSKTYIKLMQPTVSGKCSHILRIFRRNVFICFCHAIADTRIGQQTNTHGYPFLQTELHGDVVKT